MSTENISPETRRQIDTIMEECGHKESVVQSVCPHAQYCGNAFNNYYGNSKPEKFICRKHMMAHKRHDGLIMVHPFTDAELAAAFKRYCTWAYGETCDTAGRFEADLPDGADMAELKVTTCAIRSKKHGRLRLPRPNRHCHILHFFDISAEHEQGFLLSDGSFASREKALIVALRAGQIIKRCGGDDYRLFSENLW